MINNKTTVICSYGNYTDKYHEQTENKCLEILTANNLYVAKNFRIKVIRRNKINNRLDRHHFFIAN